MSVCVFCDYAGPSEIVHDFGDVITFEPLNPVTPGHLLVVPREHVKDFGQSAAVSARVAECAVDIVARLGGPCNVITSIGREATQTVEHLHLHIVPRREGDGLALPWSIAPEQTKAGGEKS